MTKFTVDADLFRLTHGFITSDNYRYYLHGVLIEPHPTKGVLMIATDGQTLLVMHDPNGSIEGEPVIMDPLKHILTLCKKPKNVASGVLSYADGLISVIHDDNTVISAPLQPIDGTFPDWRRLVGKSSEDKLLGNFKTKELDKFGPVAQHLTGRREIHMRPWGTGPSMVTFHNTEQAFGLVMPTINFIIPDVMEF